ncbi:MAG: sigma 54-interacting transcriptional regulator [Syntrophales bacterium]|nr:sigma 54-interacting transcriptional regulator [Syntrophales bacterium]
MTTRICSSLDIGTALQRSFHYLAQYMPIEFIFLHLYEQSLGAVRTISEVTATKRRSIEVITPLTSEGRASFENPGVNNTRIVSHPSDDPVVKKVSESLNMPEMSALVLRLVVEGKRLGSLAIATNGGPRYTEEHLQLVSMLNEPFAMAFSNALKYQEVLQLKERLADDNHYLSQELLRLSSDEIIGSETGLKQVMDMTRKIASLDNPVLLLGETGVGKGVIASAIHQLSPRRNGPFIVVNSGAIPETLMDSELFGHEKGAFTGATELKRGKFERAHQGTIFLDEIGEMPPPIQIRMLRVIQEKVIERVGGMKPMPVDIRIIAATHRNLEEMIENNQFRQDLWFRLNVFPISIIPLRERTEDIPALVYYFIRKKSRELKLSVTPELASGAIDRLMHYPWPGNVRELDNVIEREMILNNQGPLKFDHLALKNTYAETSAAHQSAGGGGQLPKIDAVLRDHILNALKITNGVIHGPHGAAAILGINPNTLRSRMGKLGIPYGKRGKTG